MPRGRPEVVAHRGASHEVAEHTLGAYKRAIEAGADALECDVRLTADGHLVCVHDRRVDRTSDGRGRVSALELEHLEGLDWTSWRRSHTGPDGLAEDEVPDRDAGRILTLNRLFAAVRDSGRDVGIAVETKHPTRYAGLVERTLVDLLRRYGWAGGPGQPAPPVRVMSFSTVALMRVRQLAPAVPLVQLVDRVPLLLRDGRRPPGVYAVGVSVRTLHEHPRYVRRVQRSGGAVHVWTVDRDEDLQRCLDARVDAVITNRPGDVVARLDGGVPMPAVSVLQPPGRRAPALPGRRVRAGGGGGR